MDIAQALQQTELSCQPLSVEGKATTQRIDGGLRNRASVSLGFRASALARAHSRRFTRIDA